MDEGLPLYSTDAVRRLDAAAIAAGTPAMELMRRAGLAAWRALQRHWPLARRLLVLCGPGNNGGDGYVLAALAARQGLEVEVLALDDAPPRSAEARQARAEWDRLGAVRVWADGAALPSADVVVDALYGVGLRRGLAGTAAALVAQLNSSALPVLALDVPSGIDADRGSAPGPAVQATVTVSFVGRKIGLYTGAGRAHAGRREFEDLGVAAAVGLEPAARVLVPEHCLRWLPRRRDDDHKGRFGHVLVIGGDHGMGGAARLCSEAAARCGAGLVSVFTRPAHCAALLATRPELMAIGVDEGGWPAAAERATVLAVGPGLGRAAWGRHLLARALALGRPCVLDADALAGLAEAGSLPASSVLTPHPGEAARLLGQEVAGVQSDRPAAARALARRFGSVVVLKGNGSLVADPDGALWVVDAGNPGMASGGMGDVLCGVIAALLAQGLEVRQAAALGTLCHALAGDRAAGTAPRGLLASDLFAELRGVLNP